MMLVGQSDGYDEMTGAYIELWDNQAGNVKLLQRNLTAFLNLCLVFAVLCVFQFVGCACTSVFELDFCTEYPLGENL